MNSPLCRTLLTVLCLTSSAQAIAPGSYRQDLPVKPLNDTTILCEAEEFQPVGKDGWQARPWGENYYVATFANSFLSRKGFLGAPEQCAHALATLEIEVPRAGRYLALVRYEACYRFETQFTLRVEQNGVKKLDRRYGGTENVKIWAFKEKLKKQVAWSWGPGENLVWEGHDAFVSLEAGKAKLTLLAERQKGLAARRNVDLVLLTRAVEDVTNRIEKENYLPLDGLLTQAGDVYFKLHNHKNGAAMNLVVPPGTEHSPYWVHLRTWKPLTLSAAPGTSTDWVEVGSLLDTLNDGQWQLTAQGSEKQKKPLHYSLEVGVRAADGKITSIAHFKDLQGDLSLAYDADTRYSQRIRTTDSILYDLVDYLKKQPIRGTAPKQTLIYGYTFTPRPGHPRYNQALQEFQTLIGATALNRTDEATIGGAEPLRKGYLDVRSLSPAKLEEYCQRLKKEGKAERIACVSLGDEIGLAAPPANDHKGFRSWLQREKRTPAEVDPSATTWEQVLYSPAKATATTKPSLYYYSQRYAYYHGIQVQKQLTDVLRRYLPHAGIGANFSPHHKHMYMGDTHQWISLFRAEGMTMPWGEDYIWQVPVGTQQMNFLMLDMFRCGIKGKPTSKIHYYVMPHTPGNTTASWRRQFYGDLAHGAKIFNLFEFRPVQAAYTENHCSDPAMFQEVRRSLHELGQFEDILQQGEVRPGLAGLWFSEAADIWDDYAHPLGAGKRSLYIGIRHQQLPLDGILDGDDLGGYKIIYLADAHVSRAGTKALAAWVQAGGQLVATAGAGMFDEFNQPNKAMQELLAVSAPKMEKDQQETIIREKENLPFAKALDVVTVKTGATPTTVPVFGALTRVTATREATVLGTFKDASPALVMHQVGKGRTLYCGFLPGLSYFKPAMPLRPVDRGASEDTLGHLIPTGFDRVAAQVIGWLAQDLPRPVSCSEPLVETTVIQANQGTLIPLINWSGGPVKGLKVRATIELPSSKATLASGKPVTVARHGKEVVFTLDLDAADALILR